jgi:hypothetical protein
MYLYIIKTIPIFVYICNIYFVNVFPSVKRSYLRRRISYTNMLGSDSLRYLIGSHKLISL